MPAHIALFRGINVVGKNILPMKDLVQELEALNLNNVKTYIQSGNAVFQTSGKVASTLGAKISAAIEKRRCFRPKVLILNAGDLQDAIASNPFPEAEAEPKSLHLYFLESSPKSPNIEKLTAVKSMSERFHLADRVFYLHAPDGIGRSKLAANVERCLGVAATARNWRTVRKLWDLANELAT